MNSVCAHCSQACAGGSPYIEVTYPAHFRATAMQRYTTVFLCSVACLAAWAVTLARA
jgi:hypothetical protein